MKLALLQQEEKTMLSAYLCGLRRNLSEIFGFYDENAKGRTVYICCVILNAFYNVFITGVLDRKSVV